MGSRYETSKHEHSSVSDPRRSVQRSQTMRQQKKGLDTIRKVHDSLGQDAIRNQKKKKNKSPDNYLSGMKKSTETRNTMKNYAYMTEIQKSYNNSVDEYGNFLHSHNNYNFDINHA